MSNGQNQDLTCREQSDLKKTTNSGLSGKNSASVKGMQINFFPNFRPSTLKAIRRFREQRDALQLRFPDIPLKAVRDYLEGRGDLPEEMKPIVDTMNDDRKKSIKRQMQYAREEAEEEEGIGIPEKYVTGEALDVFFAPEIYRYFDFQVYYFFSWYEPWEMIELLSGPLFTL